MKTNIKLKQELQASQKKHQKNPVGTRNFQSPAKPRFEFEPKNHGFSWLA